MRSTLSVVAVLGCAVTPALLSTHADAQFTHDPHHPAAHQGVGLMRLRRAHPPLHHTQNTVQRREWRTPQWDLLNEGIAIALSSLNGGEFTTLPVTKSAPGRHSSQPLNGGEFTTLPVTETAPGRSSSTKKSKPTSTSVPYAGGANSQRQSSSASVAYAGGANSQRASSFPSTASPTSTPKNSRPKASPTSSSKKSHAGQGAASSSSDQGDSSSTDTSSSSSQSDSATTSTPAGGAAGASTSASTSTPSGDGAASTSTPSDDGAAGMSTSDGASATPASTSLPSSTTGSSSSDAHASVDPSQNVSDGKDKKSNDHTGLIAGVCIAGGVVLLSLLLFLLYKLYARHRNASKRKDDTVWPDVSHEASFDPAPLPTHHTNGAGFAMGDESREGLVSTHEQDPFQDAMPPAADSPFAEAMSRPGESDTYATVPNALVPAPAAHHHTAYLQPEAPRTNAQPAPEYQHYVVGQTYPQVVNMEGMYTSQPATRELYHGDQPVSMRT